MKNLRLHTVDGTTDFLFTECKIKKEIENTIMESFSKFGYFEIETPTFEYEEVFCPSNNQYKLVDRTGEILALRPDFTTPIARIAATKFKEEYPIRASYLGNVFRYQDTLKGGRQNEFTQAGIELFGEYGEIYDAEVIATAINALLAVGLNEFMVELGDVNFIRGLLSNVKLKDEIIDEINDLMTKKDTLSIEEILDKIDISPEIKDLFIKLPTLFGDISIIDEFLEKEYINETSKNALINLKNITKILSYYGYDKYISIDLSMNKNMDYYTGMSFKIYSKTVGFPIGSGGRYDKLTQNFGKEIYATGGSIYINRLLDSLNTDLKAPKTDKVIKEKDIKTAIEKAQRMRQDGIKVVIGKID